MITHPRTSELVAGVAAWLPLDGSAGTFGLRVARNALEIATRDMTQGPADDTRAAARIAKLVGHDGTRDTLDRDLVHAIRTGTIQPDDPALIAHMKASALDALAIDQPRYAHELG